MVYLHGYSIQIQPKYTSSRNFVRDGADYTSLRHNTEYSLRLSNSNSSRCDAHVWIDGEKVGVWRLRPYQTATIERPANLSRKFTFVKENSYQALQGDVRIGKFENGLVKVVFKPEKKYVSNYFYDSPSVVSLNHLDSDTFSFGANNESTNIRQSATKSMSSMNCYRSASLASPSLSAGGTVLGGRSHQEFATVSPLDEIDESLITTLHLRMVVDNDYDIDFEPVIVPLHTGSISNQVPPPIRNYNNFYDDYYRSTPYYGRPWNYSGGL